MRGKIRSGPQVGLPATWSPPWSPTKGNKIRSSYLTLAFSGPKRGRKYYVTPAFSRVPNKGEQNRKWLPHPCLLGGPKESGNATSPLHSWGTPTPGAWSKIRSGPQQRGTKSEVAAPPLPSRGPKKGRKCYITTAFSGVTNKGEQNQKRLPHPCLLGGPKQGGNISILGGLQQRGTKSEKAISHLPSRGPKRGQKCYVTPAFSGIPNKGEQNHKWLPHPCLLGGPKEGGNATSPLHSEGSPTKGNKITSGYLTPAFSGAQKRAEMLRHPCILRDPQQRGTKSQVATSPLPSRGPKRGRKCYVTPAF